MLQHKTNLMKKTSVISSTVVLVTLLINQASAQSAMSCCTRSATSTFAMLGADPAFRSEHLAPLPFHFVPAHGAMITVKTTDGKDASGFEIKSPVKTGN